MYGTIKYHYRAKGDSMHMIVKAENGTLIIPVPAEWDGCRELEIEIKPASVADAILDSLDKATGGKRIDTSGWKFNRDEIYERKNY